MNFGLGEGFALILFLTGALLWWRLLARNGLGSLSFLPDAIRFSPAETVNLGLCAGAGITGGVVGMIAWRLGSNTDSPETLDRLLLSGLVFQGSILAGVALAASRMPPGIAKSLGFAVSSWRPAVRSGCIGLLLTLPLVTAGYHLMQLILGWLEIPAEPQNLIVRIREGASLHTWLLLGLSVAVLAPWVEEILFRGILYPLLKAFAGRYVAALLSAVIFASVHMNSAGFVPLAILGIALCHLYEQTLDLRPCFALHAAFNAVTLIQLALAETTAGTPSL